MADPTMGDRKATEPIPLIPLREQERPGARLPVQLTSFVGREGIIAQVSDLLRRDDIRLLTLTGPGGVGKTRLALRVAEELKRQFAEGAIFVPMAPVADPDLVVAAIAQTLGVRETGDRPLVERLISVLRDRHALLALDNFEQVLPAATLVTDLLSGCLRLTVLVTSRAALNISGEHTFPVPPLILPDAGRESDATQVERSEAVRLFVERAQAAKPDFSLTATNAAKVTSICRRLDGLPLAIELAAARVNVLPPSALLVRLDQSLALLTGGPKDAPDRLWSMRDAIAWSFELLPCREQLLFRRLAVFAGGFSLDAAEAVMDDGTEVLDGITALVNNSLLRQEVGPDDEPRFAMLETIREFALEQLLASGECENIQRRHVAWCLRLAERADGELWGPGHGQWSVRLEAEFDNFRAALVWTIEHGEVETGLRLTHALWKYLGFYAPLPEARRIQERLLNTSADVQALEKANGLIVAGMLASQAGNYDAAATFLEESLSVAREVGDDLATAKALYMLGGIAENLDDLEREYALFEQALPLFGAVDDPFWYPETISALGRAARKKGDFKRATALHEETLALRRTQGNVWGVAAAYLALGEVAADEHDLQRATDYFQESLRLHGNYRDVYGILFCLLGLGKLAGELGQSEQSTRLLGAAEAIREVRGFSLSPDHRSPHDTCVEKARADLGEERFNGTWAAGKRLGLEAAVSEGLALRLTKDDSSIRNENESPRSCLSKRELEVLRLVVAGHSDREIADTLFIARSTASDHVSNILAKLDVATRAEAAAWAVREGLA